MIVKATNKKEWDALMQFLHHYAHISPTADMEHIGWVVNDNLQMVVGINAFMGKTCQMHVAMAPEFKFTPKEMLRVVFKHVFKTKNRELVLGIVNSKNADAMKYDQHLGFKELWRLPKMHDDGGDIVVLGMKRDECRFMGHPEEEAA